MLRFILIKPCIVLFFMKLFPLPFLLLVFFPTTIHAQESNPLIALYDFCEQAKEVFPGDYLTALNNARATTSADQTPEGEPVTCIKTFENDQWYRFTADSGYTYYEVIIHPRQCATPAGMQALIIEAEDCSSEAFIYRACANPYKMEPLKFYLKDPKPEQNYFIYVDGYDGNVCTYDLELIGHEKNLHPDDLRLLQTDYDNPPPYFEPPRMNIQFQNNEVYLEWDVDAQEDVKFFLVERMLSWLPEHRVHGRVVRTIEAQNTVGNGVATYRFHDDFTRFEDGKEYCYRVLQINSQGQRAYTQHVCIEAKMIQSFSISKIFPQEEKNKFVVLYKNSKKQDLKFSVLDAEKKFLKGLTLEKVKKGDQQFTIDMTAYATGTYLFRVENGEELFEREFFVE